METGFAGGSSEQGGAGGGWGGPPPAGNDSLESLGLVDPKTGAALPTPDWKPGQQANPAASQDFRQDRMADPRTGWADLDPNEQPTEGQQAAPASQWDSPDNPYRQEALAARQTRQTPEQQAAQSLQTEQQQILSQASVAYTGLIQQGFQPQQAELIVSMAVQAANADAQLRADRQALLPVARQEVANRIAREFSLPNARIDPKEIAGEGSVEAMRARAKTLQEVRRTGQFAARQQRGADRVERGASPGSRIDYDALSPFDTIRLGIARRQF